MSRNVNFEGFSAEQLQFMLALADPEDHRTQKEIAAELGLRPETLTRWKKEPGFGEAVWDLTYRNLESTIGRVSSVLLRQAMQGDTRCLRLFFEVIGKIGAQKKDAVCTREHVAEMEEIANALHQSLTDRQLEAFTRQVNEHYNIIMPRFPKLYIEEVNKVFVEEDVQLIVA